MTYDEKIPLAISEIVERARREKIRPSTLDEREVGHPLPEGQRHRSEHGWRVELQE